MTGKTKQLRYHNIFWITHSDSDNTNANELQYSMKGQVQLNSEKDMEYEDSSCCLRKLYAIKTGTTNSDIDVYMRAHIGTVTAALAKLNRVCNISQFIQFKAAIQIIRSSVGAFFLLL